MDAVKKDRKGVVYLHWILRNLNVKSEQGFW